MKETRSRFLVDGQRLLFFLVAFLFAALPTALYANLLWRAGIVQWLTPMTVLFAILTWNISWGATHALIGFCVRLGPRRTKRNTTSVFDTPGSVAIVLPVYNEDPTRVFAGLKTMYWSLQRSGKAENFDFFILSDSTNPERWVEEEHAWATLCRDFNAFGRINYRRRAVNTDKKAGNLLEFCESWGRRYRYMVTLDADSILTGDTIVALYERMEANPSIGILQTAPKIVYSVSFWGRLQQFSNYFYGPIFVAGLKFWQRYQGNYWGHNAIIRMAPFMEHCALPDLPGREPFGGKILSHDFVEAALMQRAGFEVRLADDLRGTYEECPQDVIEHAKRDRRWCQGNMQHFWLLFSHGLRFASRVHLFNGIMGYASSLFWAMFLVLSGIMVFNRVRSQLSVLPTSGLGNLFDIPLGQHAALVAAITFSLLFLPKLLALLDALFTRGRTKQFGGATRCFASVVLESVASALIAPVMMIYHAKFVIFTAFGKGVGWTTQKRTAGDGMALHDALLAHGLQSLIGIAILLLSTQVNDPFFFWMLPVSGALTFAPFVSWMLSKPSLGRFLRRIGLLLTPEEIDPVPELTETVESQETWSRDNWLFREGDPLVGFKNAIADPYINAIRATLAEIHPAPVEPAESRQLVDTLLFRGAESLSLDQRKRVLTHPQSLLAAHRQLWANDAETLHDSWKPYFSRYTLSGRLA